MVFTSRREFVAGIATTLSMPLSGLGDAVGAPRVEVEEPIYDFTPPDNGAGPLWAFGSPLMAALSNVFRIADSAGSSANTARPPNPPPDDEN